MMMNEMVKESGTFLPIFSVAIRSVFFFFFYSLVALFDSSDDKDNAEQFLIFDVLCSTPEKKVGYTIICRLPLLFFLVCVCRFDDRRGKAFG